MLALYRERLCPGRRGLSRRELLRVGGLSLMGLSSLELERLRALAEPAAPALQRGRGNSCVFIFLLGGPSHIDLWDMKPQAPLEVRGEFKAVPSCVPGIQVCEHLPRFARQMDKICLVRSMTHRMNVHGPACSEMFTGRPYPGPPVTDVAQADDWPALSAITMRYAPRREGLIPSVVLPWHCDFVGQGKRIAGQTGGRMGERHNAVLMEGDPSQPDFHVPGIRLRDDMPLDLVRKRRELLAELEATAQSALAHGNEVKLFRQHMENAFQMLGDGRIAQALELGSEPGRVRERYGLHRFGQSLLLARRLVEAGVSLVTVNWYDDTYPSRTAPHWDTHFDNFQTLQDKLLPIFDPAFSAFVADLQERGLLATTLVVATGEFGRTPRLGQFTQAAATTKTGRDHWPWAFTVLLAGGGVRGGQVYGATTANGGYVADRPVTPADLSATILYHLGIDPAIEYADDIQHLRHRLSDGTPVRDLG